MPRLIPQTEEARLSISSESIEICKFPFRIGRESRNKNDIVPQHILERRLGKAPPNNDVYLIDSGNLLNISREHFLIDKNDNGGYKLGDRMSACGTLIKGKAGNRKCHGSGCLLDDGDIIILGTSHSPFVFKFLAEEEKDLKISWVVFDAMGVVYNSSDDVSDLLWPFVLKNNPAIDKKAFIDSYVRISLGNITCKQFWDYVGLGEKYPAIEKEYLDSMLTLEPTFIPAAQALKKDFKLGMLSNDVGDWSRHLRKRFNIDFFDVAIISGDVFLRKPDVKIFELFLEKSGAKADECVFIDDRKKNLEVAKSLGFKTLWFHRIEDEKQFDPDAEIKDFSRIKDVIKEIGKSK